MDPCCLSSRRIARLSSKSARRNAFSLNACGCVIVCMMFATFWLACPLGHVAEQLAAGGRSLGSDRLHKSRFADRECSGQISFIILALSAANRRGHGAWSLSNKVISSRRCHRGCFMGRRQWCAFASSTTYRRDKYLRAIDRLPLVRWRRQTLDVFIMSNVGI